MPTRFEAFQEPSDIRDHVEYLFDVNPVSRSLDQSDYNWEKDTVDLDDIDADSEDHAEESNVALYERRVAVEKAQLTVGEGNPLIVHSEENILIEGFARYTLLDDHFEEEQEVPVYRAVPTSSGESSESTETSPVTADTN